MPVHKLNLTDSEIDPIRGQTDAWSIRCHASFGSLNLEGRGVFADGVLAITSLAIDVEQGAGSGPLGNGLTAEMLNRFPLGELRRLLQRQVLEHRMPPTAIDLRTGATVPVAGTSQGRSRLRVPEPNRAAGERRARLTDEYLGSLTDMRLTLEREGVKSANREMAKRLRTTPARIAEHLRAARERGFLAMAGHGDRAAMPGPRYAEWLTKQPKKGTR